MKTSALTVGALTLLSQGTALASGESGSSGCPNKPLFRFFGKTVWLPEGNPKPDAATKPVPTITGPTDAEPDKASADCGFNDLLKTGGTDSAECNTVKKIDTADAVVLAQRTLANGNIQYGWNLTLTAAWIYQ